MTDLFALEIQARLDGRDGVADEYELMALREGSDAARGVPERRRTGSADAGRGAAPKDEPPQDVFAAADAVTLGPHRWTVAVEDILVRTEI